MKARPCSGCPLRTLLPLFFSLFAVQLAWAVDSRPSPQIGAFFSQGQARINPQNRAQGRQEAIQDFLAQAVSQAVGAILTPSQMAAHYPVLRDKIFSHPERYVQSHQVFSESVEGGNLLRIAGQVNILVDTLKRDLAQHGMLQSKEAPAAPGQSPEGAKTALSEPGKHSQDNAREELSRLPPGRKSILWAVAEQWDDGWHLPFGKNDPQGILAAHILQESEDFGWSVQYPPAESLSPDRDGSLASEEVLSLARNSGATHAVVGKLELLRDQSRGTRVATTLGVLQASSGKAMGEIHKEYPLGEASNQEKAMELASLVVPQLDRFLMESSVPDDSLQPTPPRTMAVSEPSKGEGLTLRIRSNRPQADWEEMEKMLREQFKSMQIVGLEFTSGGGVVRLDGVNSSFLNSLNGTRLQEGALLKVENSSTDGNGLIVTVTHPGSSQSNQ